jgi:malate dehydrogenase
VAQSARSLIPPTPLSSRPRAPPSGTYEPITNYFLDDFAKQKIAATNKELVEERAFVAEMIK